MPNFMFKLLGGESFSNNCT